MKKQNLKSVYISLPEGMILPTKTDIIKGITSKDLKEKEQNLNFLIVNILNDPYFDQMIMQVLNYILPYQQKSVKIKKLLLIYWEIIEKKKHDGKILDEFMMVCNNLRKDLTHANEYVVGMSLKLIGRIALKEIMDSLIPPIYEKCLNHIEAFVRRNAVECLFVLYDKFGQELFPDLDDKMEELLAYETEINTRRNSIVLLFKTNPLKALNFLLEKLENNDLGDFGDTTQLAIVKNLFILCDEDSSNKSKYMKIIFEFMNSKFSAVLYEISNQITNCTNNHNALSISVAQLLKILQETPDTNIKLIIVQRLAFFKNLGKKLIQKNIQDFMKIIENENVEVKIKTLKIIIDLIDQPLVEKFLTLLDNVLSELYKEKNQTNIHFKLFKYIVKSLTHLFKQKINQKITFDESIYLELVFGVMTHNYQNPNVINRAKNLLNFLVYERSYFTIDLNQYILDKILYIQNNDIFKTVFSLLINHSDNSQIILNLLNKLKGFVQSFKQSTTQLNKNDNNEEQKDQKTFMTKTIIREDGSYGTEIVEVDYKQNRSSENDDFQYISKSLMTNTVFVCNLFRNIVQGFAKINQEEQDVKKLKSYYTYGMFLVYNYYQTKKEKNISFFKELNLIIKKMASKVIKPVQQMENDSLSKNINEEIVEKKVEISQFDDMIAFRQLKQFKQRKNDR